MSEHPELHPLDWRTKGRFESRRKQSQDANACGDDQSDGNCQKLDPCLCPVEQPDKRIQIGPTDI